MEKKGGRKCKDFEGYGNGYGYGYSTIALPREEPRVDPEVVAARILERNTEVANHALNYYNLKHHSSYELVDPIIAHSRLLGGIWFHTNFTAKPKGDPDSSTKLFFSEMEIIKSKYVVTTCRPLNGVKTKAHCLMCEDAEVQHPTRGFRRGLYESTPRLLRPRKMGKVALP